MNFTSVLQRLEQSENPYPGLRPFETSESPFFFGRDQQTAELAGRLERNGFVAVVGVSGSGKSSLVGAGLIPALQRGGMTGAARWRIVVARPAGAPFTSLATELQKAGFDTADLRKSSYGLIHVARQLALDESLLLVIDQFEELFRYKDLEPVTAETRRHREQAAADAREFVQVLLAASRHQPPVYVVLTMRSDYLGDCAEFRDLPEALNESQYLIPRLSREHRKQAIECPLGAAGISPVLVQRMLNDAGDEPDQLPILQHALMRTWSHWRRSDPDQKRTIQLQDYEAIGGFTDAIDQHANELLRHTRRDFTVAIFKRLTARGRHHQDRRDPAPLSELWELCGARTEQDRADVTAVVDHFRGPEATFLLPRDGALRPETYIDIAHESLIRQWKTLRDRWLPEETESAKTFINLVGRARNWKSRGGSLLMGVDLADAKLWSEQRNPTTTWAQHYADEQALADVVEFLKASEETEGTVLQQAMARFQQELEIAGQIQQQLMTVTIPQVPYATVKAVSYVTKAVGGDFYDVISTEGGLALVVADVTGKGISAALLASNLQGMLYSQLTREYPLADVISSVNRFLCEKAQVGRYATLLTARLMPGGELEILNAGQVSPLLIYGTTVEPLPCENMPVGLFAEADFRVSRIQLKPGDRLVALTDGIIEAEDAQGEFFGQERFAEAAAKDFGEIELAVRKFCGSMPQSDDWTLLELTYRG